MDPSLRHWGLASGTLDLATRQLDITRLAVTEPVLPKGKQLRVNSRDAEAACQLAAAAWEAAQGAHAVFVEVPVGSQSARAMASYGICVGILGALRARGLAFFEVTPTEVKLAGPGDKTASKHAMIAWAMARHPGAPWPTYQQKGQQHVSAARAEHMADAVAAIYAGVASPAFHQVLPFLAAAPYEESHANPSETG
jgi:hypothetical protein